MKKLRRRKSGRGRNRSRRNPSGRQSGIGCDRHQDTSDTKGRNIRFDTVNVHTKYAARGLQIDDTRVEDFNNGVRTLPVVSEFAVFTQEVLDIEQDELSHLVRVGHSRAVVDILGRRGRQDALMGGELSAKLKALEPFSRKSFPIVGQRGMWEMRNTGL